MERKTLKDLGLADDIIDKIMSENGKDIENLKASQATAKTEAETLRGQLKERDVQLETLKKADPEKLQAEITRLQGENTTAKAKYDADLRAAQLDYRLETKLMKEGAVNTKAVKALLDASKISLDGDNLIGIDEQLKTLKESEKWAFAPEAPSVPGFGGNPPPPPPGGKAPLPSGTVIF